MPPATEDARPSEWGLPTNPAAGADAYAFEGHVDFYGYHATAGGWFLGGWIAYPWPEGQRPRHAVATFEAASVADHAHSTFHPREDVSGRGIGFVFFLRAAPMPAQGLVSLRIDIAGTTHAIAPTPQVLALPQQPLSEHLQAVLAGGEDGSQRSQMLALLAGDMPPATAGGFVDFYGTHEAAGGWMFCGWVSRGWQAGAAPERIVVSFEEGDIGGEGIAALYPRQELRDGAQGVAFYVRGPATPLGALCSVSFEAGAMRATLHAAQHAPRLRETELLARLRPVLAQAAVGPPRDALLGLLARRPYGGEDTLAALDAGVSVEIDEAIRCGAQGLALMGWCLARPGEIAEIRVRSGGLISVLDFNDCIRIDRPDVLEAFAGQGFDDPRCGFIAFLPHAVDGESRLYIEVETRRREIGYRTVPRPRLTGMAAIQRLLGGVDIRFADLARAFGAVLGPAVAALNRDRLAIRPAVTCVEYGRVPDAPRFSVIVPLYGRLDFVEYQMALLSAHPGHAAVEFIYVLDDPSRRREAQFLFASVYARFAVPFRALLLDRNVGFAPVNNIGLAHAHGEFVTYLNSDVFPATPDWLDRLAACMAADPRLGAVGPLLLFEDGSVQHRGMAFERVAEFGGWFFGMHTGKGMRPPRERGLAHSLAITGACLMMRRAMAEKLDGFDEIYAVGDFEDTDLCLKLDRLGYRCAVDLGIELYHLERKSQASSGLGWRMNLTAYNAWQHERRWGAAIAARQA